MTANAIEDLGEVVSTTWNNIVAANPLGPPITPALSAEPPESPRTAAAFPQQRLPPNTASYVNLAPAPAPAPPGPSRAPATAPAEGKPKVTSTSSWFKRSAGR